MNELTRSRAGREYVLEPIEQFFLLRGARTAETVPVAVEATADGTAAAVCPDRTRAPARACPRRSDRLAGWCRTTLPNRRLEP